MLSTWNSNIDGYFNFVVKCENNETHTFSFPKSHYRQSLAQGNFKVDVPCEIKQITNVTMKYNAARYNKAESIWVHTIVLTKKHPTTPGWLTQGK